MTKYDDALRALEGDPEYWRGMALAEFLSDLGDRMERQEVSRARLAKKMGATRAYVTKALRGEANLTLLTLVKFAMAVDGVIHVHISDPHTATTWSDQPRRDGIGSQDVDYGTPTDTPASVVVRPSIGSSAGFAMGTLGQAG